MRIFKIETSELEQKWNKLKGKEWWGMVGMTMGKLKSDGIWCGSWGFRYQIWSNPMESDGIGEVLSIKSKLMKSNGTWWDSWDFKYQIFMKSNGIWWDSWTFKTQILTNPLEYDGIHGVMTLKSFQIKWNLMGFMGLWHSNLFKSNGIWWDSWGLWHSNLIKPNGIWLDSWGSKTQIWMESDWVHEVLRLKSYQIQWNLIGIPEVLQSKFYQIQWNLMGFMRFYNPNLIKSTGIWVGSWGFKTQILSSQWNLRGFSRFCNPNLIKSNGIWWDPWSFKTQTLSSPMECNGVLMGPD